MTAKGELPEAARLIRLVYLALFGGVGALAIVLAYLRYRAPTELPQPATVGLALTGAGVLMLAVAAALVRPRVPERGSNQTPDAYWNDSRTRAMAVALWALVEGAGIIGAIAYFLTGLLAPVALLVLALAVAAVFRPGALEGQ